MTDKKEELTPQERIQAAQKAVAAVLAEYRCQMVVTPGEPSVTPNGTMVIAPPALGMIALD